MKKVSSFVSPYLVLIFPVLLFVLMSFAISKEVAKTSTLIPSCNFEINTQTVIKEYPKSLIRMLLK